MKFSLISVGVLSSLASLVKGNDVSSSFHRDVIAANLKRAVAQKHHSRRKLEEFAVSDECLTALTALSEDPTFGPLEAEYNAASAAFVESADMSSCEETNNAVTCTFDWTFPQQAEFDSACEGAGGTVESYESDIQCDVDGATMLIDYPPSYACVPAECGSELSELVAGLNQFLDGLFEEVLGGSCTVGDIGSSASTSSVVMAALVVAGAQAMMMMMMW